MSKGIDALRKLQILAKESFAPRAARYDETAAFPKQDIEELFAAGLLGPLIPADYGGLGLGHHSGDVHSFWMMTKAIAKANMGLARCWEGHGNALLLIKHLANEKQKKKWFKGVVKNGELWSAWSGEPLAVAPHENQKFGTRLTKVEGGYRLNGSKVFCSGAPGIQWAILLVNTEGSGGARHSGSASATVLMIACKLSDPGISFDDAWWKPIGMKSSVSYKVNFEDVFLPEENVIGSPGAYLSGEWQTRFTPHYTATFLGGAEAALEHTLHYIKKQGKENDPYIQQRVAKMHINVETANLWLRKVATLWETGQVEAAKQAGNSARYLIEQLTMETVSHAIHACGARAMIQPSPLERIYRDLSFYVRHDNDDQVLAMVGRAVLSIAHDKSFFNPDAIKKINPNGTKN